MDMHAFDIADARQQLDLDRVVADRLSPAEQATPVDLNVSEAIVVDAHRRAAESGFLGAYPLPPIGAVDDWITSGPDFAAGAPHPFAREAEARQAADTRTPEQVEADVKEAGDDIERQLDLAEELAEQEEYGRDEVVDQAQARLREDATARGWDGVPGSMLRQPAGETAAGQAHDAWLQSPAGRATVDEDSLGE